MEDDVLPKDLNLPLHSTLTDKQSPGLPAVAGKEIYSIGRRGRSGKTPTVRKHTSEEGNVGETGESAATNATNISSNKIAKFDSRSSRSSKRNEQATRREDVDNGSDSESSMEVDEEEVNGLVQKNKIRRSTRARKVVSSSDSELSTDQSEDEELAAQLNRRAKRGGIAVMTDEVLEDYFAAHSSKKGIATSDHTLAKLSHPKMDQQSMELCTKVCVHVSLFNVYVCVCIVFLLLVLCVFACM